MLLYPLDGYEEFKELFGRREHGNGATSRRNAILLSFLKSPEVIKYAKNNNALHLLHIKSMSDLKSVCIVTMGSHSYWDEVMVLNGANWYSPLYKTDYMKGKTQDGDTRAIRYVRKDTGRVFKMKAGKMYRHLILETEFGRILPEQVAVWLCEELAQEWSGYNTSDEYDLHVDKNFEGIYDSDQCAGDFGSCMTNRDHHQFYEDSVDCSAAYITDPRDKDRIVARAVIYNKVTDIETGEVFRLCERQYSSCGDLTLKHILVNKLIAGGFIDGYKRIGADCHSASAFVDNNGCSMSDRRFSIECHLGYDDKVSYQDSFKWYDMNHHVAYNFDCDYDYKLDTTDAYLDRDENYDEYHDCYTCNDVINVYYHGRWMPCDEERLDDFCDIDGDYYHWDHVSDCDYCSERYSDDNEYYSSVTGESYCCEACREQAEMQYCEDNPDEYVWWGGQAVLRDDVIICSKCGAIVWDYEGECSEITDEPYCCRECRQIAEREYIENNPECGWSICPECDEIYKTEDMAVDEHGNSICSLCHQIAVSLQTTTL